MSRHASKADGYRLLLVSADQEVAAARLAVSQHRHGAAARLKAAERYRDGIARKLEPAPAAAPASASDFGLPETLRADFGTDEDAAR